MGKGAVLLINRCKDEGFIVWHETAWGKKKQSRDAPSVGYDQTPQAQDAGYGEGGSEVAWLKF